MSRQIIKQPNGLYAVFSSIVDGFILTNAYPSEIIEEFVEEHREKITEDVTNICTKLDRNEKPYYQFTMSWEEALEEHKIHFGDLEEEV